MIHTGVMSTDSRRSARRKRLLRSEVSAIRVLESLREHLLEAALQLRIARVFEGRQRFFALQVDLALQRRAPALRAGFAVKRPATQQVLFQRELAIAWRIVGVVAERLQVDAHAKRGGEGRDIVTRDQGRVARAQDGSFGAPSLLVPRPCFAPTRARPAPPPRPLPR